MKIEISGDIKSLVIDGVEQISAKKNLADEFLKHLGVKEYDGIVATIQNWYYGTMLKLPWCATALSYFADLCKLQEQIGKHENVDRMKDFMANQGRIRMSLAYDGNYIPKKGDVVFFSGKHDYKDCTHCGVVVSVKENTLTWVGGNTSDGINQKTNNMKTNKYVVCFGVVDY